MYDKSNLIKDTYITVLNKTVSIYGSFSYFKGKTPNESLTLIDAGNYLKYLVEKNTLRDELKNGKSCNSRVLQHSITFYWRYLCQNQ